MTSSFCKSTTQPFLLGAIVFVGSLSFVPGQAAAAEIAYTWANKPTTPSYTAPTNYSFNAGQPVKITRSSTGKYRVNFGRVAAVGGTVQVSAYGTDIGHCTIKNWSGGSVNVWCFDGDNQLADRRISILAIKGGRGEKNSLAYAWLQDRNKASYTASPEYRFGDGSMAVSHSTKGRYQVALGSSVGVEAILLASGYGGRIHCGMENWGSGIARIICNNTNTIAADSQSTVLAIKSGFPGASFVWNSSASGQANATYSHASDGSAQSVTKLSTGRYQVTLGPEAISGGNIQVSAYKTGVTCWPERWNSGQVTVRCAKGKMLIDSPFVVFGLKALSGSRAALEEYAPGRSGPRASISYKLAGKGRTANLEYEIIDGLAIYEGDIILGRHADMARAPEQRRTCVGDICSIQSPLIRIAGENYLWPAGVIPYEIDSAFSSTERERIVRGLSMVHDNTNLLIKPRQGEPDYVYIKSDEGCSSPAGRQSGKQTLRLEEGNCATGSIAHEMLHAAGVWHEQSREDRNSFVRILYDNIESGKEDNFDQHISDGIDVGDYDYGSIMHYGSTAFGKLNDDGTRKTTIQVLTTGTSIGQRTALSPRDIAGVNDLYAGEDCIRFNPSRAEVLQRNGRWKIVDGSNWLFDFGSNAGEANRSLAIIKHYNMDQVCFVGRPDASMAYLLAGGSTPTGALAGDDCIPLNPATSEIRKVNGTWTIVRDTSAGTEQIETFPNPGEAYKSLDIWRQYRFSQSCFVGRPHASFTYFRR